MDSDKTSTGDLLWLIMVGGLMLGAILTIAGLALSEVAVTVAGVIFLAFGGASMFVRLSKR